MSEPQVLQCDMAHLKKLFARAKMVDLTQAGFEEMKTARICALADAISSIPDTDAESRKSLVRMLQTQFDSHFQAIDLQVL